MIQCLVGFGSNTGDLQTWFEQTIDRLQQHPKIEQLSYSDPVRTKAVLGKSAIVAKSAIVEQGDADPSEDSAASCEYLNSVISFTTSLDAKRLFELTRKIETELGRVRSDRWTSRTVDLDILLFGDSVIETDRLTIPHQRMSFRRFVLQGAVEVAPNMLHPHSRVTLKALWERVCSGRRKVLWLVGGPEHLDDAHRVKDQLVKASGGPFISGPACWEIEIRELAAFKESKHSIEATEYSLLLYSACQRCEQTFCETARWFAGPVLNLSDCSSSFVNREIVAAVEAMA